MNLVETLRSDPSPDGMISITCIHCDSPLALHMPDPNRPERLLGICEECRTWYLIDEESRLIAPLPDRLSRRAR